MKEFSELTQQEILALAITLEEEDIRTYGDLAETMREMGVAGIGHTELAAAE